MQASNRQSCEINDRKGLAAEGDTLIGILTAAHKLIHETMELKRHHGAGS